MVPCVARIGQREFGVPSGIMNIKALFIWIVHLPLDLLATYGGIEIRDNPAYVKVYRVGVAVIAAIIVYNILKRFKPQAEKLIYRGGMAEVRIARSALKRDALMVDQAKDDHEEEAQHQADALRAHVKERTRDIGVGVGGGVQHEQAKYGKRQGGPQEDPV